MCPQTVGDGHRKKKTEVFDSEHSFEQEERERKRKKACVSEGNFVKLVGGEETSPSQIAAATNLVEQRTSLPSLCELPR